MAHHLRLLLKLRVRRVPSKSARVRKGRSRALGTGPAAVRRDTLDRSSGSSARLLDGRPRLRMAGGPMRYPPANVGAQETTASRGGSVSKLGRIGHLARAVFINRNFGLLWWGQAISSIGDYAWDTALVLWIATFLARGRSWAPAAVAGVLLAATLPQIIVGPIAGVFVDRLDKRRTMIVSTLLQLIFASLLVLFLGSTWLPVINRAHLSLVWQLGVIYGDVVVITICSQFFLPAQFALIKDIVPERRQDQAIETSQAIQGLAVILGPPIAAVLVFSVGVPWALLVNALSFAVSLLTTLAIQAPPAASSLARGEAGHFAHEFLDGFGYVLHHTLLRTILISEVLTWLGLGSLQTLGYFFITENLHAPASAYGILGADFGIGAIVGALLVTLFGERIGLTRVLWMALIISGLFVTLMSHLTTLSLALVAAFFFGAAATAIIVAAGALALHATSREFVGRVTAVINPVGKLAALISIAVAGYLVSSVLQGFHTSILGVSFDPVNTVFTGMGLLAVAGGVFAWAHLRSI